VERLDKTTKNFSQGTWLSGQDLNRALPEYDSEELPVELTCHDRGQFKRDIL
jgi:hypothetical protein